MTIEFEITNGQRKALQTLLQTGFFGSDIQHVADNLINEGLRRRVLPDGSITACPQDRRVEIIART
jgi:hypothetical protein